MAPFAFPHDVKRPGRTRQGSAIEIAALLRALDGTCPAAKEQLRRRRRERLRRVRAVKTLTSRGPYKGGRPPFPARLSTGYCGSSVQPHARLDRRFSA